VLDPLEATKEGKLIIGIKEYVAEVEREKIMERSVRGKRARVANGLLHRSGTDLYGYRRNAEGTRRDVYAPEAAVVREIFEGVATEGLSARAMWRRLNERGEPPPSTGKRTYAGGYQSSSPAWGNTTVMRILHEPAYKGETVLWRWQRDAKTQTVKRRPDDECFTLPAGVTPALVSPQIWDRAQERLASNQTIRTGNQTSPHLLRGRIFCAECGRVMTPDVEHGVRIYRCASRGSPGGRCAGKRAPAQDTVASRDFPRDAAGRVLHITDEQRAQLATIPSVETWVWERVAGVLQDPSTIALELERRQQEGPDKALTDDLENARGRLSKITKQQERLVQRFGEALDDSFPWELVHEQITRLEREKANLAGIVEDIERRLIAQRADVDRLQDLTEYLERVAHNLNAFDFDEKRLALEALGAMVYANGRDWRLECNIPLSTEAGITNTTYS
jgi:Recombinase